MLLANTTPKLSLGFDSVFTHKAFTLSKLGYFFQNNVTDGGVYSCRANNSGGENSKDLSVTIQGKNNAMKSLQNYVIQHGIFIFSRSYTNQQKSINAK